MIYWVFASKGALLQQRYVWENAKYCNTLQLSLPICLQLELLWVGKWHLTLDPKIMHVVVCTHLWKYVYSPVSIWSCTGSKGRLVTYISLLAGKKTQFLKASLWVLGWSSGVLFTLFCHCHCWFYIQLHTWNLLVTTRNVFAWMDIFANLLSFVSVVFSYKLETCIPTMDLYSWDQSLFEHWCRDVRWLQKAADHSATL